VAPILFDLLNNKKKLKTMSDCAKNASKIDAADEIVKYIKSELAAGVK